jgi:hypothetical protein
MIFRKNRKKLIIFFTIIIVLFLGLNIKGVFAADPPPSLELDWPASPLNTNLTVDSKIGDLVKYFYEWGISLGILAVFGILIFAGIQYLTSTGDPGKMKDALSKIKNALMGIALLLGSFILLNTINPSLTVFNDIEFDLNKTPTTTISSLDFSATPSSKVVLYNDSNYGGTPIGMNVGDFVKKDNLIVGKNLSVQFKDASGNTIEGPNKGNLQLVLYSNQKDGWWIFGTDDPCSKEIGRISKTSEDIYDAIGKRGKAKEITCVELINASTGSPDADSSPDAADSGGGGDW